LKLAGAKCINRKLKTIENCLVMEKSLVKKEHRTIVSVIFESRDFYASP